MGMETSSVSPLATNSQYQAATFPQGRAAQMAPNEQRTGVLEVWLGRIDIHEMSQGCALQRSVPRSI
jgi:hypothetical protein